MRQHQHYWFYMSGGLLTLGGIVAGVQATQTPSGECVWTTGGMFFSYVMLGLAIVSFVAGIRNASFPFAATDRGRFPDIVLTGTGIRYEDFDDGGETFQGLSLIDMQVVNREDRDISMTFTLVADTTEGGPRRYMRIPGHDQPEHVKVPARSHSDKFSLHVFYPYRTKYGDVGNPYMVIRDEASDSEVRAPYPSASRIWPPMDTP